jgi:hypothetical protein
MSCGCGNNQNLNQILAERQEIQSSDDPYVGKTVRHTSGKILSIQSPIKDVNGMVIGYIAIEDPNRTVRIFSKDISEILA